MREDGTDEAVEVHVNETSEIVTSTSNSDDVTNAAVKSILSDTGISSCYNLLQTFSICIVIISILYMYI